MLEYANFCLLNGAKIQFSLYLFQAIMWVDKLSSNSSNNSECGNISAFEEYFPRNMKKWAKVVGHFHIVTQILQVLELVGRQNL